MPCICKLNTPCLVQYPPPANWFLTLSPLVALFLAVGNTPLSYFLHFTLHQRGVHLPGGPVCLTLANSSIFGDVTRFCIFMNHFLSRPSPSEIWLTKSSLTISCQGNCTPPCEIWLPESSSTMSCLTLIGHLEKKRFSFVRSTTD